MFDLSSKRSYYWLATAAYVGENIDYFSIVYVLTVQCITVRHCGASLMTHCKIEAVQSMNKNAGALIYGMTYDR